MSLSDEPDPVIAMVEMAPSYRRRAILLSRRSRSLWARRLHQGDRGELVPLVQRLLRRDYFIEYRLALRSVHGRLTDQSQRHVAALMVVLKGIAHIMKPLSIDGDAVHTCRGDGIIIGTPTGSTAYLMSTGAPLVTPGVNCLMRARSRVQLHSRPMILPGESLSIVRVDHARPRDLIHHGR